MARHSLICAQRINEKVRNSPNGLMVCILIHLCTSGRLWAQPGGVGAAEEPARISFASLVRLHMAREALHGDHHSRQQTRVAAQLRGARATSRSSLVILGRALSALQNDLRPPRGSTEQARADQMNARHPSASAATLHSSRRDASPS